MFNPLKYHNSSIWSARPCCVFSGFSQAPCFFCRVHFPHFPHFPQCNSPSPCRISTTLHWSRYNSREWQPNGPLKPPSPVCLIAAGRHYVDLRLEFALSLTGDSGDSSREPRCPYQVARKYLRRSVPGLISSKGLLRDF